MRIRLTHTYHRTNPNIVFDAVQSDLPKLERLLDSVQAAQGAGECKYDAGTARPSVEDAAQR